MENSKKRTHYRVTSANYKPLCMPMELELKNWIVQLRSEGACVSGDSIRKNGMLIYNRIHPDRLETRTDEQLEICSDNRTYN